MGVYVKFFGVGVGRGSREFIGDIVAMVYGEVDVYVVLIVSLRCGVAGVLSVFVGGRRSCGGVLWG